MVKKRTVDEFKKSHDQIAAEAELKDLREKQKIAERKIELLTANRRMYSIESGGKKTYRYAQYSDVHVGSLYCNAEAFIEFIQYAHSLGIRDCLCAGDLIDGGRIYRGQEYELHDVGFARQIKRLKIIFDKLPKDQKHYFVTGNHDESFAKEIGLDVGAYIDGAIPQLNCIGRCSGAIRVALPDRDFHIHQLHPDGGTAYALSYKPQKIVESWEGGTKPNLIGIGHYHKAEFLPRYRNVGTLQAGCFQEQTPFMARKGLAAHVGGWIVEIEPGDLYNCVRTEFVAFF